jgi:hypothetical protein
VANKVSFPRIVAFFREDGANVPGDAVGPLKAALERKDLDPKVILICGASDPEVSGLVQCCVGKGIESRTIDAQSEIELIEACDALVWLGDGRGRERFLEYARVLGRQVCTVSPDGEIHGPDGLGVMTSPAGHDWLPSVFQAAGLNSNADLETIFQKTDALASLAAPVTQRWFRWIVVIQALAVVVPVTWLINRSIGLPNGAVVGLALGTIVLLLTMTWWLRWRGMQKTWGRARLVAEIARSMLITARCLGKALPAKVRGITALRHLRWVCPPAGVLPQRSELGRKIYQASHRRSGELFCSRAIVCGS